MNQKQISIIHRLNFIELLFSLVHISTKSNFLGIIFIWVHILVHKIENVLKHILYSYLNSYKMICGIMGYPL